MKYIRSNNATLTTTIYIFNINTANNTYNNNKMKKKGLHWWCALTDISGNLGDSSLMKKLVEDLVQCRYTLKLIY